MMLEYVPVHASKPRTAVPGHQRNLSLDFRKLTPPSNPTVYTHQRNRSLDSVLQRIPEDVPSTATSPVSGVVPPQAALLPPAASDDSGIHAPSQEPEVVSYATARSRESLDSGNPEDTEGSESSNNEQENTKQLSSQCSTLRLFECNLFTASMAIWYLFKRKERGVQSYLANKLFSLPIEEVDFYLPQLATIYAKLSDVADVLRPYLVHRCKRSVEFSLKLAWLLAAFGGDDKDSRAAILRDQILAEELRHTARHTKGHHRSQSDATGLRPYNNVARHLGDLASGRAFDNGCVCVGECRCSAARLAPELHFIHALIAIGRRLANVADKEQRNVRLRAELAALDLNLPAKVWLPTCATPHWILRIPLHAAAALNSKDKAPYIVYMEAVEGTDTLPPRSLPPVPPAPPVRHARSEEHLVPDWPVSNVRCGSMCDDADDVWSVHDEGEFGGLQPDQLSLASSDSVSLVSAAEVRRRLEQATAAPPPNEFRHDPRDPSARALKETWRDKRDRLRAASPYSHLHGWRLLPAIIKVGDDLRVELLAAQVLRCLERIWKSERVPLKLRPYDIICLDATSGIIQPVLNSVSLHQIKRQSNLSLRAWIELEHGASTSEPFLRAQTNFVQSAAAYSLVSYLLQLKDRHNGNILLDSEGHLVHIDFGFIMSTSPKNLGFESSPFKLTSEMVEVMDGEESDMFAYFKILLLQGLIAARKHMNQLIDIVEVLRLNGELACLRSSSAIVAFRNRFHFGKTDPQLKALVDKLTHDSLHCLSTRLYDHFQYYTNGIL